MDTHIDNHLTRGDTSQNTVAEGTRVECELGDAALNEDLVPNNLSLTSANVHLCLVTDDGNVEDHERQSPIHPFKSDQEPSNIQAERNDKIDLDHDVCPQSNPDQDILPVDPKEVSPSEGTVVPAGEPTPLTDINDVEAPAIAYSQELRARTVCSSTPARDEGEADPVEIVGLTCLADDEDTREDFNGDFHPSLPPSSSPPQLFSSSPCASSQSSINDGEPPKMALAVESESCSYDYARDHYVESVTQDVPRLDSKDLHGYEADEDAASSDANKFCSQTCPASCDEGDPEPCRKRIADPDEPHCSQRTKRPKLGCRLYPPPAPKRATPASQHHQFQKLAAPFRPPQKFPGVADGQDNGKVESTISTTSRDKIGPKGFSISLRQKAANTSRSTSQFKSPLVNRVLPADARTIRLTPALQALERKLQLLKRAIKVKEDNEEEVLTKFAEKWIEAGREVAYDVWNAIKDTGDFVGKATFYRRSRRWESADGNTPWGWDTKPRDAGEESCDVEPEVSCATGRVAPEEDDDAGSCNTLGNMLRQLGIAPEIFGWDDDKETFSD